MLVLKLWKFCFLQVLEYLLR